MGTTTKPLLSGEPAAVTDVPSPSSWTPLQKNAHNLGVGVVHILMWIGMWGAVEMALDIVTHNDKTKFVAFTLMFLGAFAALLFLEFEE